MYFSNIYASCKSHFKSVTHTNAALLLCLVQWLSITVGFLKYAPTHPLYAHYFEGRDICLNILVCTLLHLFSQTLSCTRSTIPTTAAALWKNGSFGKCVLQEIKGICVHTKPRGIEATCIVSADKGQT